MRSMSAALWLVFAAAAAMAQDMAAPPASPEPDLALELLGGPDGDPPQPAQPVTMVQAVAATVTPAAAVSNVASSLDSAPPAPPQRAAGSARLGLSGPVGAVGLSIGAGLCWQAQGAQPGVSAEPANALILGLCDGRETQRLRLQDGVLIVGDDGAHEVRPLAAPARGCRTHAVETATRAYEFRLCAGQGALVVEEAGAGRTRITAFAEAGAPAYVRGAPLMVDAIASGRAEGRRFEYVRRGKRMRLAGTDLCVAPPAGDVSDQAPLYLDACAAPSGGDAMHLRASFVMNWR